MNEVNELRVSVSPHLRSPRTTQKIMLDVLIALCPALVAATVIFGPRALLLTAVSAAFCVVLEFTWEKLMKKPVTVTDLSAVVTGVLLAFNVPASMPIWELLVGDAVAIICVKMLFGGIGCNFVNPALVGRVVMFFSFTADMTNFAPPAAAIDALSSATPLELIRQGSIGWSEFGQIFLGVHGGVLGETCAAALLLGGVYLCVRKVIKPIIPLAYMGSCLLFSWLFGSSQPVISLFAGGLMLGAIFMATDYVTTPTTDLGKLIFGLGCGLLTALMRCFASSAGAVSFSILLMNLVVPYINDLTAPKPFGGVEAK